MRWVRFSVGKSDSADHDGQVRYGILQGDSVQAVHGDPFQGYELSSWSYPLDGVRLEVPVIPRTFYAAGMNYARHVQERAARLGEVPELPRQADIGYRANNALIADGDSVCIPADAGERIQYEGELVVVIGRKAHKVSEAEALDYVLGYTIGNDVSERDWQKSDRTFWRSKNSDTFKPMGPWIETELDVANARTSIHLNGQLQYEFDTSAMIFGIEKFISTMSRYLTLWPGDVIWMGTDGSSPNLSAGDVVEVSISGLGTLRNPFVKASTND